MSDSGEQQSPFGPGFVAACIVIGAVVVCGGVLLISGRTPAEVVAAPGDSPQRAAATIEPGGLPEPGGHAEPGGQAEPGGRAEPGGQAEPGGRPESVPSVGSSAGRGSGSARCRLDAGEQAVPERAPSVDGWEVSRRIVVPRSATYGPVVSDADGFRRCFAHSPTGAVYAAYSAYAAMADQGRVVETARRLMVPGRATDALIRELQADPASSGYSVPQLAGYRVIDAGPDRVSLLLAAPVESAYMSLTLTLVWHDGDWRLQPPAVGEPVGAPFAQHRDLSDFVAWSGV